MALALDVLRCRPAEAARRVVLGFLDEARAACDRLADPEDAEALHAFRVAIRRTRSTVRAWRKHLRGAVDKPEAAALRNLQRATGGGRDAEVALAWLESTHPTLEDGHQSGYDLLTERLAERHGDSMDAVRAKVRLEFTRQEQHLRARLAATLDEAPAPGEPCFGAAFVVKVRKHLKTLRKHLRRIRSIGAEEEAHEARIRGKRLRYLAEPVAALVGVGADLVDECKRLQDVLGDFNDTRLLRAETVRQLPPGALDGDPAHAPQGAEAGLVEIARRLAERQRKLFRRLRERWLRDGAARLVAAVEALVARVERILAAADEFERKFLLSGAPALPAGTTTIEIEQGYLGEGTAEERVRREQSGDTVRYVRTQKFGTGLRRLEHDEEVDADRFEALWPLTDGRRVRKRRHVVREDGHVWEVDEFLDRDLWIAEVELADAQAEVAVPAWLAPAVEREVTEAEQYANRHLAQ